jgi:hypothetical protein
MDQQSQEVQGSARTASKPEIGVGRLINLDDMMIEMLIGTCLQGGDGCVLHP